MIRLWPRNKSPSANADGALIGSSAPSSYLQWSDCLDRLATGDDDDACLARMRQGTLELAGGVAPLFLERIANEVQRRLTQCSDHLTRDLKQSNDESHLIRALLQARQQLAFVHQLTQLPTIPDQTKAQLAAEIAKFATRSERSLLESAKADRSGRLAFAIKRNSLMQYTLQQAGTSTPSSLTNAAKSGRRIILD